MGKKKFKLSDMIPNAWFYKLKYIHKPTNKPLPTTTHPPPPPPSSPPSSTVKTTSSSPPSIPEPRKSYHFTRDLPLQPPPDTPRNSKSSSKSRKSTSRRTTAGRRSLSKSPETDPDFVSNVENATPVKAQVEHFNDIIIDVVNDYIYPSPDSLLGLDLDSGPVQSQLNKFDFQLPNIITKLNQPPTKEEKLLGGSTPSRRFSISSSTGVRLKVNSPRIMGRKQGQNGNYNGGRKSVAKKKKNVWESLAVVKSSNDPQRDFRESMVEMIVQNNLKASKDLEDLLACYLSLNSDEYHDVIIKVFKQLWYDLSELRKEQCYHRVGVMS